MAAHGTHAADVSPSGWVSEQRVALCGSRRRISRGFEYDRLHRGPECHGGFPLGRRSIQSTAGPRSRIGAPTGSCDLCWRPSRGEGSQGSQLDYSDRIHDRRRPRQRCLNRPGGNATGINLIAAELEAKRLVLLHELVPAAVLIGALLNPKNPNFETQLRDVQGAARAMGQIELLNASSSNEIEAAFATLVTRRAGTISVGSDPFFLVQINQLIELQARNTINAIHEWREFVAAGGLLSYGVSLAGAYREAGIYVGRILKGEKPADLPVVQPTKFELVINMKTAKALGIDVPVSMQLLADEVIE